MCKDAPEGNNSQEKSNSESFMLKKAGQNQQSLACDQRENGH